MTTRRATPWRKSRERHAWSIIGCTYFGGKLLSGPRLAIQGRCAAFPRATMLHAPYGPWESSWGWTMGAARKRFHGGWTPPLKAAIATRLLKNKKHTFSQGVVRRGVVLEFAPKMIPSYPVTHYRSARRYLSISRTWCRRIRWRKMW